MSIDINGKILSCPQYIDLHTMNLIKNNKVISKKEFISYYNHGLPKQVREELRYVPDNKCLRCSYFGKKCSGGCPLVKFEIGPYVDKLPN
jgi:radical SAM protein with 4Fe4S-binding SPASM domain